MERLWTFSVTGYNFKGKSLTEVADVCRAAGIAGIEGCPPLFEGLSEAEAQAAGTSFRAAGLCIDTFHLPFDAQNDVSSFYQTLRRKAVEDLKPWIVRAAATGAKVAILHPMVSQCDIDQEGVDPYMTALTASLSVLLPFAAEHKVILALENMLPRATARFCTRPEHLERISRELEHPALGFCLDTGHALVAGGPEGAHRFFEAMEKRLVAFHLSDTAGDRDMHIAPGRGLVNWDQLFRAAARIGFDRTMCIETPPFAHIVDGGYALPAWRELVGRTRDLALAAVPAVSARRESR